ncbi:MAG: DUF3857 domain-containing protein [Flavobacteriaceae bacterium]|nr:MAG: DUF3857 domain-containing protein [Flavobacteriaceae bacterium]
MQLASLLIPQELKEDANAVIRNESTKITLTAVDEMSVKVSRTITVLNKLGRRYVDAYVRYDNDTKIVSLSAEIYDALGKKIKRVKKKDFLDFSAVEGGTLYSDDRVKQLEYTPVKYPYTVKFEYEYKTSSTGFIPGWRPMDWYYVGIQESTYQILNPAGLSLRKKESRTEGYAIENLSTGNDIHYRMQNQPPIAYERGAGSFFELTPVIRVAANNFTLKGVRGKGENWQEFGKWRYEYLYNGKDVISGETKIKVQNLVKGISDPIEKAKIIYNYMQNKTRYISVQEGIGGWKPIAANQVDKVGYGDCKGLTNYTKTLLDAVGVKSHYSVIWAGSEKKDVMKDFTSMQGNHVILNIPNEGKDIWLECTSQIMPFGFLGDFTDDRNVLVITPEGGIIKRTPAYLNEFNLQTSKTVIALDAAGNVKADILVTSKGIQYDRKFSIESIPKEELKKYYKTKVWDYNNNLTIDKVTLSNNKDSIVFSEKLSVNIQNYAATQQGAYLFRANVFNKYGYVPKRYRNRKLPLKIPRGFKHVDEFIIKLPEGYILETLPADYVLENQFGTYRVTFKKIEGSRIKYNRELLIRAGDYPKEDYKAYRRFLKKVTKYDNLRLSLIKKT